VQRFANIRFDAVEELARKGKMADWAMATVERLGLQAIMAFVTDCLLYEGFRYEEDPAAHPDWPKKRFTYTGQYRLILRIPLADKEAVCPHLRHIDWDRDKEYRVLEAAIMSSRCDYLAETWDYRVPNGNPRAWKSEMDNLSVEFYRPVEEGERINGSCVVERVPDGGPRTRLALVCQKNGDGRQQ
jgi:hypothetical protein